MAFYDLPKDQVEDLKQYRSEAKRSSDDLAGQFTEGIGQIGGLVQADQRGQNVTGVDPAMMDAITRRTQARYARDVGEVNNLAKQQAVEARFSRLKSAADLTAAEHAHNEQVKMAKYADKINRKRARAAMLGNILGIVGAGGGALAGGAPGAMAGYQIGQGTGSMAGGGTDAG